MVERYAHLSPDHLHAAVARLVPTSATEGVAWALGAVAIFRNYPARFEHTS